MTKKGFTLVEMLAVVIMLGLISSIAMVSISRQRAMVSEKEKDALRSTITSALQIYRTKNTVEPEAKVNLGVLSFTNNLSYSKVICSDEDLDASYVSYVYNVDENNNPTREEVMCIKFVCDGNVVIDDYDSKSDLEVCH